MNFLYPRRTTETNRRTYLSLIWTPIILLIVAIVAVLIVFVFRTEVGVAPLENFDSMIVSDGFHSITLPDGKFFLLSYEADHDRVFDGLIRHYNNDHELVFPILASDILVTTGDFSDRRLVSTNVEDHHFYWSSNTDFSPLGTINLLHTVPMNQAIQDKLTQIKVGDHVIIKGWEIFELKAYSKEGNYLGMWKDSGCNSLLVTDVFINP
ncbi:MAG: hypothetical protein VB013_08145 [Anaerolineaceae bacterium]|nr:hypothetical protein [Anaerolineaceae bacterium]